MSTELAKNDTTGQLPAFLREKLGDTRGAEKIQQRDVRFPALKLAQSTTKETKRQEPVYIEGLLEGELFNSVTRERYGEDPVYLQVVAYLGHRYVEFDPKNQGVVIDGNVPDGDPRTQFTEIVKDGQKLRQPPIATEYRDFLVLVEVPGRSLQVMTLSFKRTQLKHATTINTIVSNPAVKLPTWAYRFKAAPVPESWKNGNSGYGWRIDPAGWPTEEAYALAEEAYTKFIASKDVAVIVETEAEPATEVADSDIPF